MPLVWLPLVAAEPLQKTQQSLMARGAQLQWPSDLAATEANLKSSSLEPVARDNFSHTNVYWVCVLKHLQAQAPDTNWVFRAHVSIFLLCPLTSNPKNLSLVGKNRNRTGKAMDLKSVSGISVDKSLRINLWKNCPWKYYGELLGKKKSCKVIKQKSIAVIKKYLAEDGDGNVRTHDLSELK